MPYQMLCPFSLGVSNELVVDDLRFGSKIDGAALAEYSQLFALAELLSAGDIIADNLYLFQYRKFISPNEGGLQSVAPWVKVLTSEAAGPIFPTLNQLDSVSESRIIVGSIFELGGSISENYSLVHVVDDFVMFAAACAQSGQIKAEDIRALATMRGIVPSPALSFIKVDLFLRIIDILRNVWREFSAHYQVKREGYQRRVSGYLLERLHSLLLCQWLMDGSEPNVHLWQRYVVNTELSVSS